MIDQNTKIIMSYRELEFHDKQIKEEAYQQGASDMEKAKQIIIDKLLVEIEQIRAETIEEVEKELLSHGFIFTEHALEVWHGITEQLKEQK